eukprot:scaffold57748_cov69-Phaeocystis_antarctica.AAC.1
MAPAGGRKKASKSRPAADDAADRLAFFRLVVQMGRQGPGERAAVGSEAPRVGSGRCWSLMPASAYEANFERRYCRVKVGSVGCTAT